MIKDIKIVLIRLLFHVLRIILTISLSFKILTSGNKYYRDELKKILKDIWKGIDDV